MYWIEKVLQCEFAKQTLGFFYTLALTSLKNHMVNVLFADT